MTRRKTISAMAAGMIALVASGSAYGFNGADKLLPGNNVAFKIKRAQMGITAPAGDVCPKTAKMALWVFTNKPGPVTFMVARKGQAVGAPKVINSVKGANGVYMATYTQNLQIVSSIDAEYRALIAGGSGITSNWAPLKVTC